MSKSWRKNGGSKDSSGGAKRAANQKVRRIFDIPDGNSYRRLYQQWDICDWNCTVSSALESYRFHNPHLGWSCMCDTPVYSGWTRLEVDPPQVVMIDRNCVLPPDYGFTRRYMEPEQRVNPETGSYEKKIWYSEWRWYGHDEDGIRKRIRPTWHLVTIEAWVENPEPSVVRYVERPFFTDRDVREHVKGREEQTRNYRKKNRFPRYGRRDRKRIRNMKRSSHNGAASF